MRQSETQKNWNEFWGNPKPERPRNTNFNVFVFMAFLVIIVTAIAIHQNNTSKDANAETTDTSKYTYKETKPSSSAQQNTNEQTRLTADDAYYIQYFVNLTTELLTYLQNTNDTIEAQIIRLDLCRGVILTIPLVDEFSDAYNATIHLINREIQLRTGDKPTTDNPYRKNLIKYITDAFDKLKIEYKLTDDKLTYNIKITDYVNTK